jgi:hypothetical protein
MVSFDEYADSRNRGSWVCRTNQLHHKETNKWWPVTRKRAGTCGVLFCTAHARLKNANAVENEQFQNRAHYVVHRNTKGGNDKEYVTNEEEERRTKVRKQHTGEIFSPWFILSRPTLKLAYNGTARDQFLFPLWAGSVS